MARAPHIVHVNSHVIRKNRKLGLRAPPIVVRKKSPSVKPQYTDRADILVGGVLVGSVVYSPEKPLSCGAVVYIELDPAKVTLRVRAPQEVSGDCEVRHV